MKTLNGYRTVHRKPSEGEMVYSLTAQRVVKVVKLSDGSLTAFVPGFKWMVSVDKTCIVVQKSQSHKIQILDHQRKLFQTINTSICKTS